MPNPSRRCKIKQANGPRTACWAKPHQPRSSCSHRDGVCSYENQPLAHPPVLFLRWASWVGPGLCRHRSMRGGCHPLAACPPLGPCGLLSASRWQVKPPLGKSVQCWVSGAAEQRRYSLLASALSRFTCTKQQSLLESVTPPPE